MDIRYGKPDTLSDPYADWGGYKADIIRVVNSDPKDLTSDDYWMIFHRNLPAANYQEGSFYVPYFLDFYSQIGDFESPNVEGFFWFVDHFSEDFARDGLLEPILGRIWEIFLERTREFRIHHFAKQEIERYQICNSETELVLGSRAISDFLDYLTKWEVYSPILLLLKEHFSNVSTQSKSLWYFQCAYLIRVKLWIESGNLERQQNIFDYFHRIERYSEHHAKLLYESDLSRDYMDYFRRLL